MEWDRKLAGFIDHTVIKVTTTEEDVHRACKEALCFGFAGVVVSPYYLPLIVEPLRDSFVKTCTTVSFPLGAHVPEDKAEAADRYIRSGAQELDVVMNVGAFLSGRTDIVRKEILSIARVCRGRAVFKLIIETGCLGAGQIAEATRMAVRHGADYVKTSTGFGDRGATVTDVEIIKDVAGDEIGIKASGGITTPKNARALLEAGATRLGCSQSLDIIGGRS
jgi:deoxyribose-phosphate aldolase